MSLGPSNPGGGTCVFYPGREVQDPFRNGKRVRGERFCSSWAPRGLPGAGLQAAIREAAFCSPDPLQRAFRNTFFHCCSGQPRRSRTLSPRFSCLLPRRGGPATCRKVFPSFFGSIGVFWPKIVCPGFVLSLSRSHCCLWKLWNCRGCYLLFDFFPFYLLLFCLFIGESR